MFVLLLAIMLLLGNAQCPTRGCDCGVIQDNVAKILKQVTPAVGEVAKNLDADPNWKRVTGFAPVVSAERKKEIETNPERPDPKTGTPDLVELHSPVLIVKCVENCGDNPDDKFVRYDYVGDLSFLRAAVPDDLPGGANAPREPFEPCSAPRPPASDSQRCFASSELPSQLKASELPFVGSLEHLGVTLTAVVGSTAGDPWNAIDTDGALILSSGFCVNAQTSSFRLRLSAPSAAAVPVRVNGTQWTFTPKAVAGTSFFDVFGAAELLLDSGHEIETICLETARMKFVELCLSEGPEFVEEAKSLPAPKSVGVSRRGQNGRSVFGTDTRKLATTLTTFPNRAFAAFRSTGGTGSWCSGVKVGPRHVLTAGHCVYDDKTDSWITGTEIAFGQNGNGVAASNLPFGVRKVIYYYSVKGWTDYHDWAFDYGMVVLPDVASTVGLGWFGYSSNGDRSKVGTLVYNQGHPGGNFACAASPRADGMCGGFMYGDSGKIEVQTSDHLKYTIDTNPGQSGSPIYQLSGGQRYVVGVHAYGKNSDDQNRNKAVRIRSAVYNNINSWKSQWPSAYD